VTDSMQAPITPEEITDYQNAIGRIEERFDVVDQRVAKIFAATLNEDVPTKYLRALWHYGLFLPLLATPLLDADGHPPRGDFLPAVRLPRRMFAGSSLTFHRPLAIGDTVWRRSRIASVEHRRGNSGDLVFVRVAQVLMQGEDRCIEEEQTIVYRPGGGKTAPVLATARAPLAVEEQGYLWLPTTTELFRYSAATFNAHRIHYELPYAQEREGYPGLVVHGPLIATRLCAFAEKLAEHELAAFTFRGEAPCFVNQEIRIVGVRTGNAVIVRAERADGKVAMSGRAVFG